MGAAGNFMQKIVQLLRLVYSALPDKNRDLKLSGGLKRHLKAGGQLHPRRKTLHFF